MPETPDFEKLAHELLMTASLYLKPMEPLSAEGYAQASRHLVEQLRLVWNARGAADLATIDTSLASQMGPTAAGPYVKNLDRELRKLDR